MSTGINFNNYDDIPVEATGRDVPQPIEKVLVQTGVGAWEGACALRGLGVFLGVGAWGSRAPPPDGLRFSPLPLYPSDVVPALSKPCLG